MTKIDIYHNLTGAILATVDRSIPSQSISLIVSDMRFSYHTLSCV